MTVALRPWSLPGAGRTPDGPVSEYGRVPGPGRARASRPGCSLQPRSLAGRESSSRRAAADRTVYTLRALRDRLATSTRGGRGPPGNGGRRLDNQEVKMAQGTVKWFNGEGPTQRAARKRARAAFKT